MQLNLTSNLYSSYYGAPKRVYNENSSKSFGDELKEETQKEILKTSVKSNSFANIFYYETANKELEKRVLLSKITKDEKIDTIDSFNPYNTFEKPATMTTKEAIERSDKIQQFYQNEYEDFLNARLEYWVNKDNPDYEPPQKYAKYLKQIKDVDPRDIIYDGKLVRLPLAESELHLSLAHTQGMKLNEGASMSREWKYQFTIQTPQNRYEDAPEFEAFVNKWIDKGLSEEEALQRAEAYASLGLLDYGKQRATMLSDLPYGDKKQHGFHLIDNEPLKQAVLETLDTLSNEDVWSLKCNAFGNGITETSLNFDGLPGLSFQDFLNNFASLESLKDKYKDLTFDGNINLTKDMDKLHRDFIIDNIKAYFEHRINDLENIEDPNSEDDYIEKHIELIQMLIDNFDKKIKEQEGSF